MRSLAIRVALLALGQVVGSSQQDQRGQGRGAPAGSAYIDAVVLDSKGVQTTNLGVQDFTVLDGSKPLTVASVSYVAGNREGSGAIAIVADNCDSKDTPVRSHALADFVDDLNAGDLVSILPVAESGALGQQVTNDRALLREAIRHADGLVRTYPAIHFIPKLMGADGQPYYHGWASLEALNLAIDELAALPGRKTIVLLSERAGWPLGAARRADDRADQGNIEIHRIDRSDGASFGHGFLSEKELHKDARVIRSRLESILDSARAYEAGYYLIGIYSSRPPGLESPPRIHVALRRSGLTIRSRSEYYTPLPASALGPGAGPTPATAPWPLAPGLRMQAIPLVSATLKDPRSNLRRPVVRAVASIDLSTLRFAERADGSKSASVTISAEVLGRGAHSARSSRDCSVEIPASEFTGLSSRSMLCELVFMPDAPGPYMVRMEARDTVSGLAGSAYALAAVPNFNTGFHIIASTLELSLAVQENQRPSLTSRKAQPETTAHNQNSSITPVVPSGANLVQRVFAPGDAIEYECDILGPQLDKAEGMPHLQLQVRIAGGGFPPFIFISKPEPLRSVPGDRQRAKGRIDLPMDIPPGFYDFSLIPIDTLTTDHSVLGSENAAVDFWIVQAAGSISRRR